MLKLQYFGYKISLFGMKNRCDEKKAKEEEEEKTSKDEPNRNRKGCLEPH